MDKKGEASTSTSANATAAVGSEAEEENAEMWNADAVGSLTTGAILSLKVSAVRFYFGTMIAPAKDTPSAKTLVIYQIRC
jgi:hypothetical protein